MRRATCDVRHILEVVENCAFHAVFTEGDALCVELLEIEISCA